MKKTILTIIGLAMASPAWTAQTAVTQISGTQASVGALKTQVNTKLGTVESNRQDHETRVSAMETGKAAKPYINASAPADTSLDWYDTDQEPGVWIHKKHSGTTWEKVGSHGVQYLPDCAGIAAGLCVNTGTGKLYYHNNTAVVEVGTASGSYTLPTASANTLGGVKVGARLTITDGVLSADVQSGTGAVDSVNGATGTIVLDADDISDTSTTKKFTTAAEKTTWNAKQNALVAGTDYLTPNGSAANLTSFPTLNQNTTGSAATLTTARTIGGVSFNGSANINLPGVNTSGTQNTTGNASTATALAANGANCSAGQAALGVNASGAAEGCWTPSTGSMTYPSANNFGWTTNGTSWSAMGLDTDISTTSDSDDTIPSAKATKAALGLKANASSIAFEAATWADLKILDTTHTTAGTGIAIAQDSMAYGNADDAYHLWSIDKIGSELAGKQASDSDLTSAAGASSAGVSKYWGTNASSVVGFYDLPAGGGTPTTITVADTTDTAAFIAIFNDATGDLGPKTDAGLTYNATTGMLTATGFTGPLTGTASGNLVSGGAAGTPSSITLTNATGLPLSGVVDSTTEALGAGTLELGHASDTTLARSGAGVVTIEGVAVVTASSTVTKTNLTLDTAGTGNSITVPLNGVLDGAITDPADADDMIFKKVQNAMTLTDIHCLAEGGGTITLTLQECTTAGASCANIETAITCDADGAEDDGTLSDASIAAGAWIKVLYSAPTGTVNNVAWTVYGTQTW